MKKLARRKNKRQKEQDNVKQTEINTLKKKKSRFPVKRMQGVLKNFERFLQNLNNNQTTTGTHD